MLEEMTGGEPAMEVRIDPGGASILNSTRLKLPGGVFESAQLCVPIAVCSAVCAAVCSNRVPMKAMCVPRHAEMNAVQRTRPQRTAENIATENTAGP